MIFKNNAYSVRLLLVLAFFVFLAYSNTFESPFHFDDADYIVNNRAIKSISDLKPIFNIGGCKGRFIALYSFALNYHFHKYDVFGYHLVNIIIHIITSILVWWFLRLLLNTRRMEDEPIVKEKELIPLFGALLFALHPIQTQAVTYISQRMASMATMFYLLSICMYAKARESGNKKKGYFVISVLSGLLGMFTKEIVFTLPVMIMLFELYFYQDRKSLKGNSRRVIVFILIMLAFCLIIPGLFGFEAVKLLTVEVESGSHAGDIVNSYRYLLTQFRVIVKYIQLLFVPLNQNLDYDFQLSSSFFEPRTIGSLIMLLMILGYGISVYRKNRLVSFGIVWFFVTLLVESSIIPIKHVIFEHRLYLPMVGFSLAFMAGVYELIKDKKKLWSGLIVIVIILSLLTFKRNQVWQDEFTLWSDVIKKSPYKSRGYLNRGISYYNKKRYELAIKDFSESMKINSKYDKAYANRCLCYSQMNEYNKALADCDKALEINKRYAFAYNVRGNIYNKLNRDKESLFDFDKALKIEPRYSEAYNSRGVLYKKKKLYELALADFTKAIELDPKNADVFINRAIVYEMKGAYDLALVDYDASLNLSPNSATVHNNKGLIHNLRKEYDLALLEFNEALKINPKFAGSYNNRGILYGSMRQYPQAISDFSMAIKISPEYVNAYNNRAATYNVIGKLAEALKDYNKAIFLKPDFVQAYYNRGIIYIKMEKYDLALKDYSFVINKNPEDIMARFQKAGIMMKLKRFNEALKEYDMIIQLSPNTAVVYLKRSQVYFENKDYKKALDDAQKAKAFGLDGLDAYIKKINSFLKE